MTSERCYLLDASVYIFRAYFSLPDAWRSEEGYSTSAVYGYVRFLLQLLTSERPRFIGACFDESLGSCFRNELYPYYKSSRAYPDDELIFQLEACKSVSLMMGIPVFVSERYEADDLIATLAHRWRLEREQGVVIVSRDKDLGQLLNRPQDVLWDPASGSSRAQTCMDRHGVFEKFGVLPEAMADYQALVGDPVDDIPGISGVGAKKAAALLQAWGNLEGIYDNLDQVAGSAIRGARSLAAALKNARDEAFLYRQLTTLSCDAEDLATVTVEALRMQQADVGTLSCFASGLGFAGALQRPMNTFLQSLVSGNSVCSE